MALTEETKREALKLYDYHGNARVVATMLHIPQWYVNEWLKERGTPHRWMRKAGKSKLSENIKTVKECHADGMNDIETAQEMGVSREYIRQIREFLGLPKHGHKPKPRKLHPCKLCKTPCPTNRIYCGDVCARRGIALVQRGARPDVRALADLVLKEREDSIEHGVSRTMKEIAEGLGISQAYVHKLMRRFHPHARPMPMWSSKKRLKQIEESRAKDAKVLEALRTGATLQEAAALAGVGYASARDVMLDVPLDRLRDREQGAADDPGASPERDPQVQRA